MFPISSLADDIAEVKTEKAENGLEQSKTDSTEYTKTGQKYSLTLCPQDFTPPVSLTNFHALCVHYANDPANLNSGYSKYAKAARVHYYCTVALQTPYARMSAGVGCIHGHKMETFTFRVILFCW